MTVAALILAAGSGTRLGRPKQFLPLAGDERLVDRAVSSVRPVADWIAVVLPPGCTWDGATVDASCGGGESRHSSLRAGLALVPAEVDVVLVHSASHPLATADLARRLVEAVIGGADGAVPFLDAVDVVKRRDGKGELTTVGREGLGSAQCPMAFERTMLDRAFAAERSGTEESQLVEAIGGRIVAVGGEVGNVHVVDEPSLAVARALAAADVSSPAAPPV